MSSLAQAEVPLLLSQQGRLLNSSDEPVTGTVAMVFSLYTAGTGGTANWTETHTVTLDSGYFVVTLGDTTALTKALFNGNPLYLGIKVGTDAEMTPREELVSVPYAVVASDVTGDIHPTSISVNGSPIVNSTGQWVGSSSGLVGPTGPTGPTGATGTNGTNGTNGTPGATGATGATGPSWTLGPQYGAVSSSSTASGTYISAIASFTIPSTAATCFMDARGYMYGGSGLNGPNLRAVYKLASAGAWTTAGTSSLPAFFPPQFTGAVQSTTSLAALATGLTGGGTYSFGCQYSDVSQTTGPTVYCIVTVLCF